ncbi:unnamed protein product [Effrenium voratum]|nr:unnamed protein product [Effrenium voratum]
MANEQGSAGNDQDMDVVHSWDGGQEGQQLDSEFRGTDCLEVEFEDDDIPDDDEGDGMAGDDDEEIGVIPENEIYSDEDTGPQVDDSLVHGESVLSVALSPTDRSLLLTGGQDDVAVLWTIHEKDGGLRCTERCRLQGHTDSVVEVAFSTDGVYAATASYDGTVRIWNAADGSLVQSLDGPSKEVEWILWHPKGHAILGGSNDTMAWMWWAPTGKVMQIFAGHGAGVSCGCWGLGGKVVVTGSEDHGVIVWNPRAGTPQHHLREVHESSIISICSHPESPIVVTGAEDATAKVVQIETGKVLAPLPGHIDSVEAVAFSNAKGTLLLATGSMDGTVQIWDAKSMDLRCTVKEHFEKGGVVKLKWLPGSTFGNWFCTCSTDRTLRLFNGLSGECLRTLQGHSETVLGLDLSIGETDGKPQLVVASASEDKSCRVFVVALWTAGVEVSPGGVTPASGYGHFLPASSTLPSPALQATGSLEAPLETAAGTATPQASPGNPLSPAACVSPSNVPV